MSFFIDHTGNSNVLELNLTTVQLREQQQSAREVGNEPKNELT